MKNTGLKVGILAVSLVVGGAFIATSTLAAVISTPKATTTATTAKVAPKPVVPAPKVIVPVSKVPTKLQTPTVPANSLVAAPVSSSSTSLRPVSGPNIPVVPVAAACQPKAEVCNGIDDNCDGRVDDGNLIELCRGVSVGGMDGLSCQRGVCRSECFAGECASGYSCINTYGSYAFCFSNSEPENDIARCTDNYDNDSDGSIDCADPKCREALSFNNRYIGNCVEWTSGFDTGTCRDGQDNDRDGHVDCADVDCQLSGLCGEVCNGRDDDNNGTVDDGDKFELCKFMWPENGNRSAYFPPDMYLLENGSYYSHGYGSDPHRWMCISGKCLEQCGSVDQDNPTGQFCRDASTRPVFTPECRCFPIDMCNDISEGSRCGDGYVSKTVNGRCKCVFDAKAQCEKTGGVFTDGKCLARCAALECMEGFRPDSKTGQCLCYPR